MSARTDITPLEQQILSTLLYYDIFAHPLTAKEIFLLLPQNSITASEFEQRISSAPGTAGFSEHEGQFFIRERHPSVVRLRREKEQRARRRWKIARFMALIIRRFPFVRALFVSGDLAKNVANAESDIDFVVITAPRRLWICRTLLILFKKTVLLNSKKYFCLNYFVSTDQLVAADRNYFTATEIVHMKPLYNFPLFLSFMNANCWIKKLFPNYLLFLNGIRPCGSRSSVLRTLFELPFAGRWADSLDLRLMTMMGKIWKRRYPHLNDNERDFRFRCSPTESRAFGEELGSTILAMYKEKLSSCGIDPPVIHE